MHSSWRLLRGLWWTQVLMLAFACANSPQVEFPLGWYAYPEIAKRLSVDGRQVQCVRTLQERVALLNLHQRSWEEMVALLEEALQVRVRQVNKEQNLWQMEPDPEVAVREKQLYQRWVQRLNEWMDLYFSVPIDANELSLFDRLSDLAEGKVATAGLLSHLVKEASVSPRFEQWLRKAEALPDPLWRAIFTDTPPTLVEAPQGKRALILMNLAGYENDIVSTSGELRPFKDRKRLTPLVRSVLSHNRAMLCPSVSEALTYVYSGRSVDLFTAALKAPRAVQNRLVSELGVPSLEDLRRYQLSVQLERMSAYQLFLSIDLLDEDRKSLFRTFSETVSGFDTSLPEPLEKRLKLLGEMVGKDLLAEYRALKVGEDELLKQPIATRSVQVGRWRLSDREPLSSYLYLWSAHTEQEVALEVFPVSEPQISRKAEFSLVDLVRAEDPIQTFFITTNLAPRRLVFRLHQGVLMWSNLSGFMDHSVELPIASLKELSFDVRSDPLHRLRRYARKTRVEQNLQARVTCGYFSLYSIHKGMLIESAPFHYTIDAWCFGYLLDALPANQQVQMFRLGRIPLGELPAPMLNRLVAIMLRVLPLKANGLHLFLLDKPIPDAEATLYLNAEIVTKELLSNTPVSPDPLNYIDELKKAGIVGIIFYMRLDSSCRLQGRLSFRTELHYEGKTRLPYLSDKRELSGSFVLQWRGA